jgi:hypothetical protein
VGIVARISGCASQKEVSLDDQVEHAKEEVMQLYSGTVEYRVIATKGKGEQLDRPELADVRAMIRSCELDLLLMEDVGRLVRGTDAVEVWGLAVDHGTRCIAPNDCLDTADESWEEDLISACRDHVGHNAHTSKRLKKKLMLRFKRLGAATPCPIAGYIKPDNAATFHDWYVDETLKPIVLDAFKLLCEQLNCSSVADYFNRVEFPVGPYCRNSQWDGKMVRRYFENAILKGKPERGNMHSVKHYETGRRRSVRNPEGPVSIEMPHLQIIPELEFDELNALLDEKNSGQGRKPYANGQDPLKGIPRKRTRFPGQHARCWYCGRIFVWGGNGIKENLQCSGSRSWWCWNSTGLNGGLFCQIVIESVVTMLSELDGFDDQFRNIVEEAATGPSSMDKAELIRLTKDEQRLKSEEQNLMDAIAEFGPKPVFGERLRDIEMRRGQLTIRRAQLERIQAVDLKLPANSQELRQLIETEFLSLATDSYEFGTMMQKIVPDVFVHLVRMIDGGPLYPRVTFRVDLSNAFSELALSDSLNKFLTREFTADAFELPTRAKIREQAVALRARGKTHKQIVELVDVKTSALTVAKALALDAQMSAQGLTSPLVVQSEPPSDTKKMRRHLHPRYSFEPAAGYEPPNL